MKNSLLTALVSLMATLFTLLPAHSDAYAQEGGINGEGSIVITSTSLSADNKSRTAVFEGDVHAIKGEVSLFSDRMTVFYSEDGKVDRIEAAGNVRLTRGSKVVISDAAEYTASSNSVMFTGNPKATEGENVITGSKITYLIDEDRSIIKESKVFLQTD